MEQLVLYTIEIRPCGSSQWSAQGFTLERAAALKTALDLWLKSNPSQPYSSDVRVRAKALDLSENADEKSPASVLMDFCCPYADTSASFASAGSDYDIDHDAPRRQQLTQPGDAKKTDDGIFSIDIDSFKPLDNPVYDPSLTSRTTDVRPSDSCKADKWRSPDGSIDAERLMHYLRHEISFQPLRFPTEQYKEGVLLAAEHLISQLNENASSSREDLSSFDSFREHMLFGASDWQHYAWSGCWLIGDGAIARTFLNSLQLSFVGDDNRLHSYDGDEHVIDIMAGALATACQLLAHALVEGFDYDDIIWF